CSPRNAHRRPGGPPKEPAHTGFAPSSRPEDMIKTGGGTDVADGGRRREGRGAFVLLFVTCCAGGASPQQPSGTIVGTVTDATGAVLPWVTVTVTNGDTRVQQIVVTG